MTKHGVTIAIIGGICALIAAATAASAGTAYLSHTGSGSTCSQTMPCADMPSALTVAGAGGEVICLDKGSYSSFVQITQSVTISCGDGLWENPGATMAINTPAGSDVVIEGLVLDRNNFPNGAILIIYTGQGVLHLRRVRIGNQSGSTSQGLSFVPAGPTTLHITDSVFYNLGGSGVLIRPSTGGSGNVHIRNSRFEHNLHGVFVDGTASTAGINVNVAESAFVDNQGNGIGAFTGTAPVTVSVVSSQITSNVTGLATAGSGQIFSFGGNQLRSNGSGNGPVTSIATQ